MVSLSSSLRGQIGVCESQKLLPPVGLWICFEKCLTTYISPVQSRDGPNMGDQPVVLPHLMNSGKELRQ